MLLTAAKYLSLIQYLHFTMVMLKTQRRKDRSEVSGRQEPSLLQLFL